MAYNQPANSTQEQAITALTTEQQNPATSAIDRMSPLEIAQVMNAEDAKVATAIEQELPHIAKAIEEIAARLRRGGRLIYVGAGTSGRLGVLDAAECPPTFQFPPERVIGLLAGGSHAQTQAQEDQEDRFEAGEADLVHLGLRAEDIVVGLAASGRTPYVLGAVHYANTQGALSIGITCNACSPLASVVQIMIAPVVGPEVIAGSTRLKAGTAQKMVLNMLSTGSMILLGKTFGNLMVDVRATNYKLHQRAVQIISIAAEVPKEEAEELLHNSANEVKTAILVGKTHLTPVQARAKLAEHSGILRAALDELL
ncbi:MAG: N-acetylmuramic acid 6-phosphate etherase [Ktedonobacteraceae bacterium]